MFIVNAPFFFTGIWAMIKIFLDEGTRKKISILGTDYKSKLLEFVILNI